jgi:UDP-N-acetylglucosamine 4,6-dehydratase
MLNNKIIFITGGTGSLGPELCKFITKNYKCKKIIIFSRDEVKQRYMKEQLSAKEKKLFRFFLGDVRDKERLIRAMEGVDIVIHAAALKQIDTAEYNPFEVIKTNIIGAQNVIDASLANKVKKVLALSTDKAANPINLYGATKLVSDKLFSSANNISGNNKTIFSIVRYGNVSSSRGSVIPYFKDLIQQNKTITLTNPEMTRFWITLDESIKFIIVCLKNMVGGEIFIPKIPSIKITDLIQAMKNNVKTKIVGLRPGEKIYETMCPQDEAHNTLEYKNYFLIKPSIKFFSLKNNYTINSEKEKGKTVKKNFEYNSKNNTKFLTVQEIKNYLKKNN